MNFLVTGPEHHRPVRSFVRRAGRITTGQKRALKTLWPRFGLDYTGDPLELAAVFGRDAPCILEIGFGNGELLVDMATAHPEDNYLGIEVHEPGVGRCLLLARDAGLKNLRVFKHDANEVLANCIPPRSLTTVNLFFPDPWQKKRHHKRRLVQPAFAALIAERLIPGGEFHVATDWRPYAEHIQQVMSQCPGMVPVPPRPRPITRFERRGRRLGHQIRDQIYRLEGAITPGPNAL